MNLFQRLKRLDDAVLPRAGSHRIERAPTRWKRWVAAQIWQAALMAAAVTGLLLSAAWTLPEYQPQLNNFVLRALLVGGISSGLFAAAASELEASVRVRDRLRELEESQREVPGSRVRSDRPLIRSLDPARMPYLPDRRSKVRVIRFREPSKGMVVTGRTKWLLVGAVIVLAVAGWIVPDATTEDRSGSPEDDPIAMAELHLGQPVRQLLTVGYDVQEIAPADDACADRERYRVTARSWWFLPITTYEVGCGPTRVVSGL